MERNCFYESQAARKGCENQSLGFQGSFMEDEWRKVSEKAWVRGYWCKKREYISNDFRVMWNVSVRRGTQKKAQTVCHWLYLCLCDFYLFVLLSLHLAKLDLAAPAAHCPCSSRAQSRSGVSASPRTGQHLMPLDSLQGLTTWERRCRRGERRSQALIPTPVITYWSSCSYTRGMQNRFNMLQLHRAPC